MEKKCSFEIVVETNRQMHFIYNISFYLISKVETKDHYVLRRSDVTKSWNCTPTYYIIFIGRWCFRFHVFYGICIQVTHWEKTMHCKLKWNKILERIFIFFFFQIKCFRYLGCLVHRTKNIVCFGYSTIFCKFFFISSCNRWLCIFFSFSFSWLYTRLNER